MEINPNTVKNTSNINNNKTKQELKQNNRVLTETEKVQYEYPDSGLLKSYAGIVPSKEEFISAKELNDYCDTMRMTNPNQREFLQKNLANKDGNVSRKNFELFKEIRLKSNSIMNAINITNAAKENDTINNTALSLINSLVDKGSKFPYGFDTDFLRTIKDTDGKFNKNLLNIYAEHSNSLKGYLLRAPETLRKCIKDNENKFDSSAIEFFEEGLKSKNKPGDIINDILAGKDSSGKFSEASFAVYKDLKDAKLELWQINKVRSILSTFKPEEQEEAKQFMELAKTMKDDQLFLDTLNVIEEVNSDTSATHLKYNKESIDIVKNLIGNVYHDNENLIYVLKHTDIPITDMKSAEIGTLKRLLQYSNKEHVQPIFEASFDKVGPYKNKLRFDKLDKYLDLYMDGSRDININAIKHLSNCLSLEENDDAFNTFYKLYTMKWHTKSKFSSTVSEEKLNRDKLDFILSLSTKEANGIPGRKCHPLVIERLNKLMTMQLPMSSRDAFSNFMFASDIKDIEKLERVNLSELGLNAEDITSGKIQNIPEENLVKLKTFLKDYLKDKNVNNIRINRNDNLEDILEIVNDSAFTKLKLLYNINDNNPITDVIEKDYINSNMHDIIQKDYKHGVELTQRYRKNADGRILESQTINKYDANNKLLYTEDITPSEIDNVYDIKRTYPDGKVDNISKAYKTNTGNTVIEKHMVSLDGTKTIYRYEDDPLGNRIMDYKITTPEGKELLNDSVTFEVLDDNHYVTSRNNKKFDIQIKDNNMFVKDLQSGKIATLELENFTKSTQKDILPVLKQLPGEDLFAIKSIDIKSISRDDSFANAGFSLTNNLIGMNKKYLNPEVLLHEIGHGKDHLEFKEINEKISDDKVLNDIYNKEKEAFRKHFSDAELTHIGYFAADYHYLGRDKAIMEGIAETNTVTSMAVKNMTQAIRAHYWQQYFPKTVAYIAKLIH